MLKPDWPSRIAGDEGHERIAACLVSDIQSVPEAAKMVLGHIDEVSAGRASHQKLVMNAYVLTIQSSVCEIAPLYKEQGEKVVNVPTTEFRAALVAWISQINRASD
ncbi:MAG: hypothetical protein RIB30_04615 [Thalassospira sp.]|uniref:hypothetical protein n=1 Tax=Thalassospira sp. TaxID=1912094 RepID=UPI0032EBA32D